jgi:prepilin-type N-terminal cleavage/methylation domain-containing protein
MNNSHTRAHIRGFTIIELMVVISIIGLLSSVVLVAVQSARDRARVSAGTSFASGAYQTMGDRALAYYQFNNDAGNSAAYDSSFSRKDATYCRTFPSPSCSVTVSLGTGLSTDTFDGKGNSLFSNYNFYAQVPTGSIVIPTSNETVSLWMKTDGTGSQCAIGSANNLRRIIFAGQWYFGQGGSIISLPTSPVNVTDNKWHNFAYTLSTGASQVVTLYFDGKQVTSTTLTSALGSNFPLAPETGASGNWTIGAASCGGVVTPFNGFVDDVMIFNQAVAYEGMQKIYAEGAVRHNIALK